MGTLFVIWLILEPQSAHPVWHVEKETYTDYKTCAREAGLKNYLLDNPTIEHARWVKHRVYICEPIDWSPKQANHI